MIPPAPPRAWPSKLRGWLRRAAVAACFVPGGGPWPDPRVPLALLAAGGLLHLLSKAYLVRRSRLAREGPYRWVRHPFYLANLLIEPGLLLWAGAWWAVPAYLAVAHFAYRASMAEEERDLADLHGEAWTAYAARVPRLLPLRGPCPRGDGPGFSLRSLIYEKEIPRLVRLLSLPLGISWWHRFLDQPGPLADHALLPAPADGSAMLLVGFVGAQCLSWVLAGLLRTRGRVLTQ